MLTTSRIGALLHTDHMATIQALQELEGIVGFKSAPTLNEATKTFLSTLASTLREEVERHFGFEEDHLFPEFLSRGESGIVMMLTHEHRSILPLATQVASLAEAAVELGAFAPESWRDFKDAGAELVEREIFHIQKEEMGLLGAIAALLDPATDTRLAETYASIFGK